MLSFQLNEVQKFIKNFFFKILSSIIKGIVNILIISHYSEALHVDGFGKFNFPLTYSSYFIFLTSMGMDIVAIRIIAADRTRLKEIVGVLIPFKLIISIFIFLLMITPMLLIPKLSNFGWIFIIFSSIIFTVPFSLQYTFDATKRLQFTSAIDICANLIYYFLVITLIHNPGDLQTAGLIILFFNFLIVLCHNIVFTKLYGKWKFIFNKALWKKLFLEGMTIGFIQISIIAIHYLDIFMLGFMADDISVGLYSASYRAMFMIISLMGIFHNLINPILFENYKKNFNAYSNYFQDYCKLIIYLSIGIPIIFAILAVPFLDIFYNLEKYHESIFCFRVLLISLFVLTLNAPFHVGLLSANREKIILKVVLFQLAGNITGNLILIPKYGIIGSAVSTIITEAVGLPFYIFFFKKIIPVKIGKQFFIAILSAVPMSFFLYYAPIHFIPKAFFGGLIMIAFAIIFRGYTIDEIIKFKNNIISRTR